MPPKLLSLQQMAEQMADIEDKMEEEYKRQRSRRSKHDRDTDSDTDTDTDSDSNEKNLTSSRKGSMSPQLSDDEEVYVNPRKTIYSKSKIPTIKLEPHQVNHFNKLNIFMDKLPCVIDASMTGSGKTYVSAKLAKDRKLKLFILAPLTVGETWEQIIEEYDIPVEQIMTYQKLAGKINHKPDHGYLIREDHLTETSEVTTTFITTQKFDDIIKQGILLAVDESQFVKNGSSRYNKAVKAMIRRINEMFLRNQTKSRAILISATPVDKKQQLTDIIKLMGYIVQHKLYEKSQYLGLDDMIQWAKHIDPITADNFVKYRETANTHKKSEDFIFDLFMTVFKPNMMSIMPLQFLDARKDIANGYYKMSALEEQEYLSAVSQLKIASKFDEKLGTIIEETKNIGELTKAINRIQRVKVPVIVRQIKDEISKVERNFKGQVLVKKFCLFADYNDVIDLLLLQLKEYAPVELTGRLTLDDRLENLEMFQMPDNKCRIIICNTVIGGIGVNMHDITGLFPRISYLMANYKINELQQATGRTFRSGTKGIAKIRIVYGQTQAMKVNIETSIYNSLQRKGEVMSTILKEQREAGVLFPNEYPDEFY